MRLPRFVLVLFVCYFLFVPVSPAQIDLEDRAIEGKIGLTNVTLAVPAVGTGPIGAQSVGLSDSFDNVGVVFGGTLQERDYTVVVQAYDGGVYWLTSVLDVGAQQYRFGYAGNVFATPGYPNFVNGVYLPVSVPATLGSPDPIGPVDLLECAGRLQVHFVESDGAGGFFPSDRIVTAQLNAHPRFDPAAIAPPYGFRTGSVFSPAGGSQARFSTSTAAPVEDLFVRESTQPSGPDVRYQLRVDWGAVSNLTNPECPEVGPSGGGGSLFFEGLEGTFGALGAGGAASAPTGNPGIFVSCDASQDVFVVIPDFAPVCPDGGGGPSGGYEGCVNLIGEDEVLSSGRTVVTDFSSSDNFVGNAGESPAPFSDLFDNFIPGNSEGFYEFGTSAGGTHLLESRFALNPLGGVPLNLLDSPTSSLAGPPENGIVTGTNYCMVPGVFRGTVTLRDSVDGGAASGAVKGLVRQSSSIQAFGPASGVAQRDFRLGFYDALPGIYTISYENVFANPDNTTGTWSQPRIHGRFFNSSTDPVEYTQGGSRIELAQPNGETSFDPVEFIDVSAGGLWTGALVPGTQVAERAARTIPIDYEICYSTLRIQIDSTTVLFFDPRINSAYTGSFQDDAGTPGPEDDVSYGVFPLESWLGLPDSEATAATTGFVNMQLPEGQYTDLSGFITTVLGPELHGTTELPAIDVDLACGESCTATTNAVLCLSPIDGCNDADIAATDEVTIAGTLNHDLDIVDAFYRVGDGLEVPIDPGAAGIACGPAPCSDTFAITVAGFQPCRNRIEITFVDVAGRKISAFLATTIDTSEPFYLVDPSVDPEMPPYVCGEELHFSPPASCDNVPASTVPLPDPHDNCSAVGDPESPLIPSNDAPAFFPFGTTVVRLAAVDACGNGTTCDVPVIIEDTTAPTVNCGAAGLTLPADGNCTAPATISATINDNCDPVASLTVTHHVVLSNGTIFDGVGPDVTVDFPLGLNSVEFEVVDTRGQITTCTAPVEVIDLDPPALDCPFVGPVVVGNEWDDGIRLLARKTSSPSQVRPVELEWFASGGPYVGFRVVMPPMGVDPMIRLNGTTLFNHELFTEYDDPGVLLDGVDYFYRIFGAGNGVGTFECEAPEGADVSLVAETFDNCAVESVSNSRTGATLDASDVYPPGTTEVSFTSIDTSANSTTCDSILEIVDTTPPDVACPGPLTLVRTDPAGTPASDPGIQAWLAAFNASDLCGGVTIVHDVPADFPAGCSGASNTTTVSLTATDETGREATCDATLTILLDQDADGYACETDCDDMQDGVNPGALEICDGIDNDCDTAVDEEPEAQASCEDGNACTVDSCMAPGTCEHMDTSASCDDGNACTVDFCDPLAGCASDDVSSECDDGIACTVDYCDPGLGCQADAAEGQDDLDADCPRTIGFYRRLCEGPHPEDELTAQDAACVNDAATFAWISSVDDICDVLQPNPANDKCEQAESQLVALMLNLCKAHLTPAAPIASECTSNQTVGESATEADLLLANSGRTFDECVLAQCECEEVNSGSALGIPPE